MNDNAIMLISAAGAEPSWVRRVLECFDQASRPTVHTQRPTDILAQPKLLQAAAVAWVLVDHPGWEQDRTPAMMLSLLQEREIPALLSRQDETVAAGGTIQEGVVAGPPDAEPTVLAAVLRTLLGQAAVIRVLSAEVKILQAHHSGLCDQIGKIDEELRLAAQLQREFLPATLPSLHRVEFRVLFRPAGYVSGDIYDVLRLDDDHVGFFVADAVGHGVPAALMTMFIKRSLHVKEIDPNHPHGYRLVRPDQALVQLNRDLIQQQADQVRTATACYGVLNCKTLELQLARAGHPFPIVLRADGTRETLEPDGGLLGVFDEMDFGLSVTQLAAGDRLLLYSDGFELAFPGPPGSSDDRVANNRYTQEFGALAHGPLDQALARLVDRLEMQAGSLNQRDDLTVVCLGVNPETS